MTIERNSDRSDPADKSDAADKDSGAAKVATTHPNLEEEEDEAARLGDFA